MDKLFNRYDPDLVLIEIVKHTIFYTDLMKAESEYLIEQMEAARKNRKELQTIFENFNQKSNQLYNLLSTVMKSITEMRMSVTRNVL